MNTDFENALARISEVRRKLQKYSDGLYAICNDVMANQLDNQIQQLEFAEEELRGWHADGIKQRFNEMNELQGKMLSAALSVGQKG